MAAVLNAPIILLCSERSGSNLVTRMFDAHPEVAAPGTSHLFKVFARIGWAYPGDAARLRSDVVAMFRAKVSRWAIDELSDAELDALIAEAPGAAQAVAALMDAERAVTGKPYLFIKENHVYDFLPFLEGVAEAPRYLHLVRDPRDMAASWKKAAVMRGGVVRSARRWAHDQAHMLRTLDWFAGIRPAVSLTYEELVSDGEGTLRRACAALGLEFTDTMLSFHSRSRSAQDDAARAAAWSNLDKPLMSGNFDKFKAELSDDEIAYVEGLCGPLMARLGYASARPGLAPFGSYPTFEALETALVAVEPMEKPQYADLPAEERARFEHWSALHASLAARPGVPLLRAE